MMKKVIFILLFLVGINSSKANILINPDFTIGADGLDFWYGFALNAGPVDPALFVTANTNNGSATVSGYNNGGNEVAFYTELGENALASGTYLWQATISNIGDTSAEMFIKVFNPGYAFVGSEYQHVDLSAGVMSLTFTHSSSNIVQFGFSGFSTTQGYGVSDLSVTVVPEPSTIALSACALASIIAMRMRKKAVRA